MNEKQAKEVHEHFQLMGSEQQRQWQEYYMAKGEWALADAINGPIFEREPVKKKKSRKTKVNEKKRQRVQRQEVKSTEKELRKELFNELEQHQVNKIDSWVYLHLRNINRKNPVEDIEVATSDVYAKVTENEMPIGKDVIKLYIEKRVAIIQKHPNAVKRKKKKASPNTKEAGNRHDEL